LIDLAVLHGWRRWLGAAALIALFVAIARAKSSERWRWRWGNRGRMLH
jgi:hypothetical protein